MDEWDPIIVEMTSNVTELEYKLKNATEGYEKWVAYQTSLENHMSITAMYSNSMRTVFYLPYNGVVATGGYLPADTITITARQYW
jgi:hypothetical protein